MLDILSVGNANIDLYPKKKKFPGGSADNFAVACAKLGLKSGFLGFVGNDNNGRILIKNLKDNNVKSFIKIAKDKTGTVKVLSRGFDKKFVKSIGANKNLKNLELKSYFKIAKHIHFATPPIELLRQIKPGLSVSVDSGSELSRHSIEKLRPYLKNVKIFFASESEAKKITSKDYKSAGIELLKAGVKMAVIKRKSVGVYVKTNGGEADFPYINSKMIDATGGGDAFASAFVSGLIRGKSIKESGNMGIISSHYKLQRMGAQNTPTLKEINFTD
jgi:ribokinase